MWKEGAGRGQEECGWGKWVGGSRRCALTHEACDGVWWEEGGMGNCHVVPQQTLKP